MTREEAIQIIRKNIPHLGIGATEMTDALEELIPELRESEDERVIMTLYHLVKDHDWLNGATKEEVFAWLAKCKESLHITETCKENDKSFADESEDERIRKSLIELVEQFMADERKEKTLTWLERQKEQKPKMTPKWLYRLEFKDSSCGLWYDGTGKWCFESGIGSIAGCKTKTLPMDYDVRYKQDGRDWFSSCSQKEDLMHWYSLEDAKELISKGFVFTRYLATEYHEYEQQTVFIKETALYREEIDIFELFGQKPAEWSEEDERMLSRCEKSIESSKQFADSDTFKKAKDNEIDWLENRFKSLRPQPSWKPSKEQMNALLSARFLYRDGLENSATASALESLYVVLENL